MLWMDVDTALASVPVNVCPLISDSDFKTIQASVAYNASGMTLLWNFVTTAGVTTQTAVTPTTGGNYDWTNLGNGMYAIEIPASGGASINNDTEGFGYFSGVATGILPWRGPTIGFRAAALNNSLIDAGTTGLLAPTVAARTLDVTATGAAGVDWGNVENQTTAVNLSSTTTNLVNTVTTYTGNTPQTGDSFARIGATGSGLTSLAPSATALSTAQWTNTLATNLGTTNSTVATNLDATVSSRAPSATALSTANWPNGLATSLTTLAGHDPGSTLASATAVAAVNAQNVKTLAAVYDSASSNGTDTLTLSNGATQQINISTGARTTT